MSEVLRGANKFDESFENSYFDTATLIFNSYSNVTLHGHCNLHSGERILSSSSAMFSKNSPSLVYICTDWRPVPRSLQATTIYLPVGWQARL